MKVALFKDFSDNILKECDNCSAGLSAEDCKKVHNKLLAIHNEPHDINNILAEYGK